MDFLCLNREMNNIFSSYNPSHPTAIAMLQGGTNAPDLRGYILFYQLDDGVYIKAYIVGIPMTNSKGQPTRFHGFHIHERGDCSLGTQDNQFPSTGNHFNPTNTNHPFHSGDLPPILADDGIGILSFYTTSFAVNNIIERSIIMHEGPDDFTSQPAGNSGAKIACGKIMPYFY